VLHDSGYFTQIVRIGELFFADLREDVMKLNEANSLPMVAVSGFVILGAIGFLIFWALQTAYALG
jgi:hypothetical protein